jgi:purine catabolism regulator
LLQVLKPLMSDEVKNGNELIETLSIYLHQNGNVKETARILYCHYNSVLYRLERIEAILHISVRDPEHFFELQLAIRIYEFMKKSHPHLVAKLFQQP